ncbi:MAG: iron-containing redox enzyme family protein [Rhodospirillaceae bacterium]|nr:iron-containing redox enzyme family protein [Rhodospirillaceae bacterium]
MSPLNERIAKAQVRFQKLLETGIAPSGTTVDQYIRYLSMQYHLTKEVARYFMSCAAHPSMTRKKNLRKFLIHFAQEEELHYLVAARDIKALGRDVLPEPLDVRLWHLFFRSVVESRPFLRLGAACVLENISGGPAREATKQALRASFMTRENTKFLVLHQHEIIPHGEQILAALANEPLEPGEVADLAKGAEIGEHLYLRAAAWALEGGGVLLDDIGTNTQTLSSTEERDMADIGILAFGDQARVLA